jgi:hypothetical protein
MPSSSPTEYGDDPYGDIAPAVLFANDLSSKIFLPSWLCYKTRNTFLHTTILKQVISYAKRNKG